MASGGERQVGYSLVNIGAVKLEDITRDPFYRPYFRDIVLSRDVIAIIDYKESKIQLHSLHDGTLLGTSNKLESHPNAICVMNEMDICIILDNGLIKIMSIDYRDTTRDLITTRNLHVQGVLDEYHGVARFKDHLVISGVKQGTISWYNVSLDDGHVGSIQQICKAFDRGSYSSVTTKDNNIYISCDAGGKSNDNGVYGYDNLNPDQCKYIYKHQYLDFPSGITINREGFIFVCNFGIDSDFIHQLTDACQLVSIFRVGITCLYALFCDLGNGHLYVTCWLSNIITIYRTDHQGCHNASELLMSEERKIHASEETVKHIKQGYRIKDPPKQTNFRASDPTETEIYHLPLPPGKKYHVFFSYASPDIQWVKETVEKLERDHGFVCCEYDRDNTPGTPLLPFAEHSIKYACKTVVVMTDTAFKSGFVQHEIQMALMQGFEKGTKCVVPVLLKDCKVPDYLRILNYVDVRDPSQRDIWWPKLLSMLRVQGTLEATSTDALIEDKSIEAKTKHNHLCIKLDALITKDSLKSIKRMARSYIDRTILEKAESMDDLLSALEERGVIGVGHYTTLIDIMTYANVEIGRDEIHKTARDIKDIMESCRE
ncbi:hypothetical protein CHS0354_010719 [Potamilus streckersoni]|uniref:TIR domain-containing protein n=1 Tax=Potamilus streckersoni TaxID=2493646 RepID=A0AAE0W1F8_9BIVA|nr:hypothetical protein CHS0354_010719 [Potamilus streckersoni]